MINLLRKDVDVRNVDTDVFNVAKFFINKAHNEPPFNITHLKLQKLVYYALGWYSAFSNGKQLFKEEIEAWKYGPVCPRLYEEFKRYGADAIPNVIQEDNVFNEKQKRILNLVWQVYGKYNSVDLMERTHLEEPWLESFDPLNPSKEIPFENIYAYFAKKIKK